MTQADATRKGFLWAATAMAGAGLLVAAYLLGLEQAQAAAGLLCGPSCLSVWQSPYGRIAGIPLAALGTAAYGLLVVAGLWRLYAPRARWAVWATGGLSTAAAAFSLYLVGVQVFRLGDLCAWCLTSAVTAVGSATLFALAGRGTPGPRRRGHPAGHWLPQAGGVVVGVLLATGNFLGAGAGMPAGQGGAPGGQQAEAGGPASVAAPAVGGAAVGAAVGAAPPVAALPASLERLQPLMADGTATAPVFVEVYSDFQCPYCARAASEVLAPLRGQEVTRGQVRVMFHNYAFLGLESKRAAIGAVCAAVQGRFWEYHDGLFAMQSGENQGVFTDQRLEQLAGQLGLNTAAFSRCLNDPKARDLVEASFEEGRRRGVRATPTFFVNGQRIEGLIPLSWLRDNLRGGGGG